MVTSRPPQSSPSAVAVPVATMVESIVGCKWSMRLLQLAADGHTRPSAMLRASAGLSAKVLNERLRKMLRFGILTRTVRGDKPPLEVEYTLTPFGRRFLRILDEVQRLQAAVDADTVAAVPPGQTPDAATLRRRPRPSRARD